MKPSIFSRFALGKLFILAAACAAFHHANATLLFEDGFNYSAGSLGSGDISPGGSPWGGGSSHITVVSGDLTYPNLLDLGGNSIQDVWGLSAGSVFNTYAPQTSGSIYYSFLLDATIAPTNSLYLTALNPGTSSPNGSSDALQVDVAPATGGYEVGLRTAGRSITLDTATVLSLNTTYLVVAEYTFGASNVSSASLYLDPIAGGSQPAAAVTLLGTGSVANIDDVGFKAQGSGSTGTFLMDNILIGTTWEDVTPTPEPQSCVLTLAGLCLFGLVLRLRRTLNS